MSSAPLPAGEPAAKSRLHLWLAAPVAIVLAATATYSAAANALADRYPTLVLRFAPRDSVALMRIVNVQLATGGLVQKAPVAWASDARNALRDAPLNPAAVRTLALVAETRGEKDKAKRLMAEAEHLSRRDLPTELWLTVDAAKRDDPHGTLSHIDTALSTERAAAPKLFAILAQALRDPRISKEFALLVKQNRPWLPGFLSFADENKVDPALLADVLTRSGGLPHGDEYHAYETDIIRSLAAEGKPDRAALLLVNLKRADRALLADGTLSDKTLDLDLGPFAWTASLDPDVWSSFQSDRSVIARAAPGRRGMILQRFMALPAGRYRISAITRLITEDADSSVTVEVGCAQRPQTQLLSAEAKITTRDSRVERFFDVSPNCPLQLVRFSATGGESQTDSEFTLSEVNVRKAAAVSPSGDQNKLGSKSPT